MGYMLGTLAHDLKEASPTEWDDLFHRPSVA